MIQKRFQLDPELRNDFFHLRYLKLSKEHLKELEKDLEELEIKYQEHSVRDQSFLPDHQLNEAKLLMLGSQGGFSVDSPLSKENKHFH